MHSHCHAPCSAARTVQTRQRSRVRDTLRAHQVSMCRPTPTELFAPGPSLRYATAYLVANLCSWYSRRVRLINARSGTADCPRLAPQSGHRGQSCGSQNRNPPNGTAAAHDRLASHNPCISIWKVAFALEGRVPSSHDCNRLGALLLSQCTSAGTFVPQCRPHAFDYRRSAEIS